jgi:hypothetical protein
VRSDGRWRSIYPPDPVWQWADIILLPSSSVGEVGQSPAENASLKELALVIPVLPGMADEVEGFAAELSGPRLRTLPARKDGSASTMRAGSSTGVPPGTRLRSISKPRTWSAYSRA